MNGLIEVRRLRVEDVDIARETIRAIKTGSETSEGSSMDAGNMRAWLSRSSNILIAATEDGIPVGFALGYLQDRVDTLRTMLFFYEIEVAVAWRRGGIGSRLVEGMKAVAREEDASKMWVQTDPDNMAARALYRSMGGIESAQANLLYVWTDQISKDFNVPSADANHPEG